MKKVKLNNDWRFSVGDGGALSALMGGGDKPRCVRLPHDASVETERNPQEPNGPGNGFFHEDNYVYERTLSVKEEDAGQDVILEFEGVYQNAFVYVNDAFAGQCPYGYSDFYLDITRFLKFGADNEIKVVVKNGVPSGRWYTGGGIYRDVNLMIAPPLHLAPQGIHLATELVQDNQAVLRAQAQIVYTGHGVRDIRFGIELMDAAGEKVADNEMPITILQAGCQSYRQPLYVNMPQLWDENHPYLYTYRAYIKEGDGIVDEETGSFGIRTMSLDPKRGLQINGKTVKLRGGCVHHDYGILGTKDYPAAADRKVAGLKAAGFNAIRSSHYPISRHMLEACDRLGMYVMDEYSDVWTTTKVPFDYGMNASQWWEHDITSLVNKDYNHPSVIMYSIGNEIPETGNKFDTQFGKKLADKIRSLDDSRYVTNSMNLLLSAMSVLKQMAGAAGQPEQEEGGEINTMMNNLGEMMKMITMSPQIGATIEEASAQVDIVGYNYAAGRYEMDGQTYKNRIIVGSETNPGDLDVNWELVEKLPYVIGDFDWTAWDYLGENGIGGATYGEEGGSAMYSPYPYKAAYCGDINLIGDRRPTSYWREIIWGLRSKPYIAVCPPKYHGQKRNLSQWSMTDAVRSWTWEGYENRPITVEVYTLAEEAELLINGETIERKKVGEDKKGLVSFETIYQPGVVEVIAYTNGQEGEHDGIATAEASMLTAYCDFNEITADGSDIAFVEVALRDAKGTLNPDQSRQITIAVDGPGEVVGFGSAAPKSEENYFDTTISTFEGRAEAAIRATGEGMIRVSFSTEVGEPVTVEIQAK